MGAAALTAYLPRRRALAARQVDGDAALSFHAVGGPLVAVCGLVGGAGASTLAYLLARRAARDSNAPVLLAELGQQGALAALAGAATPFGLVGLAQAVAEQRPVERPFAQLDGGLRLVASARPAGGQPVWTEALEHLLADAREAHGLVVLDTGPNTALEAGALLQAGHVLFVAPATAAALRRVELLAAAGIFTRAGGVSTTLVAVATRPGRGAAVKELRRLAERHTDRLLLVPHIAELAADQLDCAERQLESTFAALATILRRQR